jgi:hypothetical protein
VKRLILSLFYLFCFSQIFSQAIPVYTMKDTVVTTSGGYFLDSGQFSSGYPGGTVVMVFNSASGSTLGVSFENLQFASDVDHLNIYDGNSVNAPLLATEYNQGNNWAVKSTGSSLTFQFAATGYGTTGRFGWKSHIYPLIDHPQPTQFSTVYNGFYSGNFDLADYDHDGDLDILNGGIVVRNDSGPDSSFAFLKLPAAPLGQWISASMTDADYDGDGYKDIFVIGQYAGAGNLPAARLFINDKKGGFTESPQSFAPAINGRCVSIDYNHDGKMDISYIGAAYFYGNNFVFKLYLNNGDGTFTEQPTNIPGFAWSSLDWADADGDGDLDIVINGEDASASHSMFLINNNNVFTEKNIGLTNSTTGEIRFADINKDGKPDIINTGVNTPGNIDVIATEIFMNSGGANFTPLPNNLPRMRTTYTDWADYDGDGDLDLLMSGTNSLSPAAYVYKNNGNGDFKQINLGNTESYSPVHWIDINGDHKLDAYVTSRTANSYIAKNINSDSFSVATLPLPGLGGTGGALIDDFDGDGIPDIVYAGNIQDNDCIGGANSVFVQGKGWQYGIVPRLTMVANLNVDPGNVGFSFPFWKWADFDNDGTMDITVTNDASTGGGTLKLYKNMGNNVFKLVYDAQPGNTGYPVEMASFVDLDNDGKNELVVAPNNVYKWNGTGFDVVYEDQTYCCGDFYMDFADYNKDGWPDMALTTNTGIRIFKNDKTGKLVELDPTKRYPDGAFVKWVDMDKDGDLDLVGSGFIMENQGNDTFITKEIHIPQYLESAIGDFNRDSFPDIFALTSQGAIGPTHLYYSQGPNFFYQENTPLGFPQIGSQGYYQGTVAVDIDNDGDLDILHSTGYCANGLLLNNYDLLKNSLRLLNLTGGEHIYSGTTYSIKWSGNNLSSPVSILFSADNGKTIQQLDPAVMTAPNGGSYGWAIPVSVSSDSCLVWISSNGLTDSSRKVFSIRDSLITPVLSPVAAAFCQNVGIRSITIANWPAPQDNIVTIALLDSISVPILNDHTIQFNPGTLTTGTHTLTVKYARGTISTVTSVHFQVVVAVIPVVTLSSNSALITDPAAMVKLTATNVSGGGSTPSYLFATDGAFTQIIQPESANNILQLAASALNSGANRIWVRMKTSDTCYVNQTAVDSLLITKNISVTVNPTPVDSSGNNVKVFPNPFKDAITVQGLNPSISYDIQLTDMQGQVINDIEISNSTSVQMPAAKLQTGMYFLRVYDVTGDQVVLVRKLFKQ